MNTPTQIVQEYIANHSKCWVSVKGNELGVSEEHYETMTLKVYRALKSVISHLLLEYGKEGCETMNHTIYFWMEPELSEPDVFLFLVEPA